MSIRRAGETVKFALLRAVALFGACAVPVFADAPGAGDSRVTQLLRDSRAALGGAALDRHLILRLDGTLTVGGIAGTGSQWDEIGGRRFAETYVTAPLSGGDGYDGSVVWNSDGSGLVWVDGGEAGRAQEIGGTFVSNELLWSSDRGGATVTWGGEKTDAGRTCDSLVVAVPGSAVPFELWFDRTTHLPVRSVITIGPTASTATFEDYHRVAGIMVPYTSHAHSGDGNSSDSHVTHVDVDPADGPARLAKPASAVHDSSIAGGSNTIVPFDLIENHVYLSLKLNGKGPYRFIFDTGGANIVDAEVAREIGATGKGSVQAGGVGAATESLSFAKVDLLVIGDATVKDQLFSIAPVRKGFGVSGGRNVDGLIGFEVLSRFVTTFDYGKRVVELELPSAASAPVDAQVIPFVLDGRQPQFACALDGIATQCTLDTGERAAISLFGPFIAAHPEVVPPVLTAVGVNGFGFGGPALGKLGRLKSVQIGTFALPEIIADFTAQTHGAFAAPFIGANVGGDLLRRFALYLDYCKSVMALVPNAQFAQRDSYERAGLFLLNEGGKKLVYDVRPETPAQAAGIVKGDVIATVNGADAAGMTLDDVRQAFFGAPGTAVRLGLIAKDGTAKAVVVTLRDFV